MLSTYHGHVGCLHAFVALFDVELDALSLFQIPEAIASDRGKVNKEVIATGSLDEPKSLGSVEPLDRSTTSFCHFKPFKTDVRSKGYPRSLQTEKRPDL
jgi:hypothetical protein